MPVIRTRKILNAEGAATVMSAAEAFAKEKGYRVVIAVVDPTGDLLLLNRMTDTQVASVQVGIDKARTAAIFVRPSRVLEEQVTAGRFGALALRGGVALTGGVPITVDGEVIGAIGTSGETPDEDESVSLVGANALASFDEVHALTFDGAKQVAQAAATLANERGVAPVVSVVDAGGELLYLWRPDEAQVASVNVATDKARTAAIFRRPSKDFEEQATKGRPSALALARGVPLQGGIPIVINEQVIGAVGVSGASSADEDQEIALAGAEIAKAFTDTPSVFYEPDANVVKKFKKGGLMLDAPSYKVDAGRREAPGEVEYHNNVTDIMYIVEGIATVVTGGEMVDQHEVGAGEIRASSIKNGNTQKLEKGDVLVIPKTVPHQFTEVSNPFLYYVVKVVD